MKPRIFFNKEAIPFILKALNITTDIPHDEIGGFYKGKVYRKDLFSIMELVDEMKDGNVAQLV